MRLHLCKQWEVARGGLLDCFIYDPYAKVVKAQFFVSVGYVQGQCWEKAGLVLGKE